MSERFWSNAGTEPKRSFRWYLTLAGAEEKIETYAIKTVKKPSFAVSEVPHQYVAHTFYFPGRVTWNTIDATFVDPVDPDQSAAITNMFVKGGYQKPVTELAARSSLSKGNFTLAVGEPKITQIDASGNIIEDWTLHNTFFTSIDYGQLDYSSEELVITTVTMRYDFASLSNTQNSSLLS